MKLLTNKLTYIKRHSRAIQALLVLAVLVSTTAAVLLPKSADAGTPAASTPVDGTQSKEQNLTEANQSALNSTQPAPKMSHSLERDNLIKRLNFTNNSNQIGYVYLMSLDGKVVANYTIKGKVSSINSMLTTTEQLRCPSSTNYDGCVTTASPDLDGSYGDNPDGIFFFTTTGAYVEWSGTYVYSSQSLNIQTAVSLQTTVK